MVKHDKITQLLIDSLTELDHLWYDRQIDFGNYCNMRDRIAKALNILLEMT